MTAIRSRSIVSVSALAFALLVTRAHGAPVRQALVASAVDWTAAGVGGVSGGTGVISLSGVSGTVRQAFLYWHGIDEPQMGGDGVYDNEAIMFAGHPIVGIPIGDSGTNCWPTIDGRKPLPSRPPGQYPGSETGMGPVHLGNVDLEG